MLAPAIPREPILAALDGAGLDESALYEGYSGRFMYGSECFGIVCRAAEFVDFVARYARELPGDEEIPGWLTSVRVDDMGLSSIYYFPGYELEAN